MTRRGAFSGHSLRSTNDTTCGSRSRLLQTRALVSLDDTHAPRFSTRLYSSRDSDRILSTTRLNSSRDKRARLSENRHLSRETPRRALRTRDAWSLRCALSRAFAGSGSLGALTTRPKRMPLIREKEEGRPPFRALTTHPTTWKKLSACALAQEREPRGNRDRRIKPRAAPGSREPGVFVFLSGVRLHFHAKFLWLLRACVSSVPRALY